MKNLATTTNRTVRVSMQLALAVSTSLTSASVALAKDKVTIAFVQIVTAKEWPQEVAAGARAAAADIGKDKIELRIQGPAGFELAKQAQIVLTEAERGADAIIISNASASAMVEPAKMLAKKNVPVTWTLSPPPPEVGDAFFVAADPIGVGSDGGRIVLDALSKKYKKPLAELTGEVVEGLCAPGLPVLTQRIAAIEATIRKEIPKATFLPPFDSKNDLATSYAAWNQAIQKYPKALYYLDPCDHGNMNIQKIKAEDKIDVPLVHFDNSEIARDGVKNGEATGIVSSNRFTEGYVAVYTTAMALLNDKALPKGWLKVPHRVIDSSNIDAYNGAWKDGGSGLRGFFDREIVTARDAGEKVVPIADYGK